jgi:hypothetical protein
VSDPELTKAIDSMARGAAVYAEGLELNDIVLLKLGSARFNLAVDRAVELIKAENEKKK